MPAWPRRWNSPAAAFRSPCLKRHPHWAAVRAGSPGVPAVDAWISDLPSPYETGRAVVARGEHTLRRLGRRCGEEQAAVEGEAKPGKKVAIYEVLAPAFVVNFNVKGRQRYMQVSVALMGRDKADTVIRGGRWVNVHSGEIVPATDVAIADGRFAYVGPDASHCIGTQTRVIEAEGRYLVPGLCDAHMHVESGMVTVTEFARAVIPHGTTSMFIDPHEIANVLGLPGVRLMHDEAMAMPVNVFVQMPSCVPSAPGLENPGATLGPDDVREACVACPYVYVEDTDKTYRKAISAGAKSVEKPLEIQRRNSSSTRRLVLSDTAKAR